MTQLALVAVALVIVHAHFRVLLPIFSNKANVLYPQSISTGSTAVDNHERIKADDQPFFTGHRVDNYPQITENPDLLSRLLPEIRSQWTKTCREKCTEQMCAASCVLERKDKTLTAGLKQWVHIAQYLNITTVPAYGSLIAALYRNSSIMPWDFDVDMFIWAHDTPAIQSFLRTHNKTPKSQSSRLRFMPYTPQLHKSPTPGQKVCPQGGPICGPTLRLELQDELHIDVWSMYADNVGPQDGAVYAGNCSTLQFIIPSQDDVAGEYTSLPCSSMFPLQRCYYDLFLGTH